MATKTTLLSTEEAIRLLLESNFDADSKECILTLLKIIDNILSKPTDPKIRTLRKHNETIRRKILDRKGGVEILLSIGFTYVYPAQRIGMAVEKEEESEAITLGMGKEDLNTLTSTRTLLGRKLIEELGVARQDVPQPKRRPPSAPSTTTGSKAKPFDPFRSYAFNANAAAHGANPNSVCPDGSSSSEKRSETEVRLEELDDKRRKMEWDLQGRQKTLIDRGIVASLPGDTNSAPQEDRGDLKGERNQGDASILASQLQRRAAERKKQEEGGFTTKAMRDLAKMKKAKVYSHARLRICFPDGSSLSASFLPQETIGVVCETIANCLVTVGFEFEVYVTPPRRKLEGGKTLVKEGLVPAAKIFVSWTGGTAAQVGAAGSFLKKELFGDVVGITKGIGDVVENMTSFPQSRPVVGSGKTKNIEGKRQGGSGDGGGGGDAVSSREEQMMQRMLGKKGGIGGGRKLGSGGGNKLGGDKKGKPKWFKG